MGGLTIVGDNCLNINSDYLFQLHNLVKFNFNVLCISFFIYHSVFSGWGQMHCKTAKTVCWLNACPHVSLFQMDMAILCTTVQLYVGFEPWLGGCEP